ncbi:MAG: hydroxymethylglutaryl-CoA reductase, degradative [Gammaproteobacteria bacterium]
MPLANDHISELFKGFSKLNRAQRLARLVKMGALTTEDVQFLNRKTAIEPELAEHFIENVIGYFHMPLGVAMNFRINQQDYVIPMAVEETSIIAAASKTARWIREEGTIKTSTHGQYAIGQIQIARIEDYDHFTAIIAQHKQQLIDDANKLVAHGLVARGGGVHDIEIRQVTRGDGYHMAVLHVTIDTCDAMGANIINQVCEFLKQPIEALTQQHVTMCILSNLVDSKITRAEITIHNIDPELGANLQEASLFAQQDPYRAATHNKGVLNGMDAVLIATGNDWRAVEAGVHAYAARSGQYRGISQWFMRNNDLIGVLEAPIAVGTVGGVTRLHPTAQMCLNMLGCKHANELAEIVAAVGLVQNLGAIKALATVGIIEGHMKLHIANLTLSAGATAKEMPIVQERLSKILNHTKRITLQNAIDILRELRHQQTNPSASVAEV